MSKNQCRQWICSHHPQPQLHNVPRKASHRNQHGCVGRALVVKVVTDCLSFETRQDKDKQSKCATGFLRAGHAVFELERFMHALLTYFCQCLAMLPELSLFTLPGDYPPPAVGYSREVPYGDLYNQSYNSHSQGATTQVRTKTRVSRQVHLAHGTIAGRWCHDCKGISNRNGDQRGMFYPGDITRATTCCRAKPFKHRVVPPVAYACKDLQSGLCIGATAARGSEAHF